MIRKIESKYLGLILAELLFSILFSLSQIGIMSVLDEILSDSGNSANKIVYLLAIFLGLSVACSIFKYLFKQLSYYVSGCIVNRLKKKIIKEAFSDLNESPEKMMSLINNECQNLHSYYEYIFSEVISQPVVFFITFVFLLLKNWKLLLVVSVVIPVLFYVMYLIMIPLQKSSKGRNLSISEFIQFIDEMKSNVFNIKVYSLRNWYKKAIEKAVDKYALFQRVILFRTNISQALGRIEESIPLFICFLLAGVLAQKSKLQYGELIVFLYALQFLLDPLLHATDTLNTLKTYNVSVEQIEKCCQNTIPESDNRIFDNIDEQIMIKDLSWNKAENGKLFYCEKLSINAGEKLIVKGMNGAGKTTLLHLISGLLPLSDGEIKINCRSGCPKIFLIPQDVDIFPLSIKDNICMLKDIPMNEIEEISKLCDLDEMIKAMPDGYDTVLREAGHGLSGGTKKKIALARAVIDKPDVLLMDETLSQMDTNSVEIILKNVLEHIKNCTVLMISHDRKYDKYFDGTISIVEGKIIKSYEI